MLNNKSLFHFLIYFLSGFRIKRPPVTLNERTFFTQKDKWFPLFSKGFIFVKFPLTLCTLHVNYSDLHMLQVNKTYCLKHIFYHHVYNSIMYDLQHACLQSLFNCHRQHPLFLQHNANNLGTKHYPVIGNIIVTVLIREFKHNTR